MSPKSFAVLKVCFRGGELPESSFSCGNSAQKSAEVTKCGTNYQTNGHLDSHSVAGTYRCRLSLLWIVRILPHASARNTDFRAGGGVGSHRQRRYSFGSDGSQTRHSKCACRTSRRCIASCSNWSTLPFFASSGSGGAGGERPAEPVSPGGWTSRWPEDPAGARKTAASPYPCGTVLSRSAIPGGQRL